MLVAYKEGRGPRAPPGTLLPHVVVLPVPAHLTQQAFIEQLLASGDVDEAFPDVTLDRSQLSGTGPPADFLTSQDNT